MSHLTSHIVAMLTALTSVTIHGATCVRLPGGDFDNVLFQNALGQPQRVRIEPFELRSMPVTIGELQTFVQRHKAWQCGRMPQVFVDEAYFTDWAGAIHADVQASSQAPVTGMSWFATRVYCENGGARLPTWLEQESATATDATCTDTRNDPQWTQHILDWYERSVTHVLLPVGGPADVHGMRDMHGLIWEWVDDFNALFIARDSRTQGGPDKQKFYGAGAISIVRRNSYAVLMCVALLSSLEGADATNSLGFRCTQSLDGGHP